MIDWLKTAGGAFIAAVLAFAAFFAVQRQAAQRRNARKWQAKADAEAEAATQGSIDRANTALAKAKRHDDRANELAERSRARIDALGERDENMADILDSWRKSNRLRDDANV